MKVVFHPEAALEFEQAVRFYEDRGRGLGRRLHLEVRAGIAAILHTPERWRVIESEVRGCRVKVFPYRVLYMLEPEQILILAIADNKRAPGYWKTRLSKKPGGA